MTHKPFFSVIVPSFNRARFLGITVNSVLTQTFEDFELLVIDDGSTDHTDCLVRQFQDPRVRYLRQDNRGVAAARNLGITQARGRFIGFLDSDDRYRADKLLVTREYIRRYKDFRVFHTEEIWYRSGQYLAQKLYHKKHSGHIFEHSVALCSIGMSTSVLARSVFDEVGLFDESFPSCEDYDFWLRVTSCRPVLLIPQYLTIKEGGHGDQLSKKYPAMDTFRIRALAAIIEKKTLKKEYLAIALAELQRKCDIVVNGAVKRGNIDCAQYYQDLRQRMTKEYE